MPYIDNDAKERIENNAGLLDTAGDLNYALTCTIDQYLKDKGLRYQYLNEVVACIVITQNHFLSCDRKTFGHPLLIGLADVLDDYIENHGIHHDTQMDLTVIGALECCKLEMYRRVAAPYEDTKIKENGDVYSPENLYP